MSRYIVAVSGASGIILATRMISALTQKGHKVELVLTQSALYTAVIELGEKFRTSSKFLSQFPEEVRSHIQLHSIQDVGCAIASGSFLTDGMIIIPCSMATVAAISIGLADNALRRAADVTLKEKRPLIIVPRETPLSTLHLENLLKLSRLGACIIPPIPAWYGRPQSLEDVENFIVGKVLDVLGISHDLYKRWKSEN